MRFENPGALWVLPALALLFMGLALWGWRAKKELAEAFQLDLRRLKRRQVEKYATGGAAMALLVGALALPQLPTSSPRAPKAAGEIALLVDVTRSMAAQQASDSPNRIERAKPILYEIVDRMEELGEVSISLHGCTNRARSLVPFVDKEDYPYLKVTIDKVLDIFGAPGEGSSLGRSLSDVADKFSPGAKAKLIVLLSDGEGFIGVTRGMHEAEQGWLDEALNKARDLGIKVITIGIGERDGAKIPLHDVEGEFTGEYAKLQGVDYISYLEEDSLREIASQTGGRYFFERDRDGLIEFVEQNLASAGTQEVTAEVRGYRYIAHWFVLAALPLWVVFARNYLLK